jgi:hypothetical protein
MLRIRSTSTYSVQMDSPFLKARCLKSIMIEFTNPAHGEFQTHPFSSAGDFIMPPHYQGPPVLEITGIIAGDSHKMTTLQY